MGPEVNTDGKVAGPEVDANCWVGPEVNTDGRIVAGPEVDANCALVNAIEGAGGFGALQSWPIACSQVCDSRRRLGSMVGMYSEKFSGWLEVGGSWKVVTGECRAAWAASLALSVVTAAESLREGDGERN